jgi:hypothetical protein
VPGAYGLIAASLLQVGRGLAIVGLVVGVASYLSTRYGRRPRPGETFTRANYAVQRQWAKPLTAIGLVGAVIWIVAALR